MKKCLLFLLINIIQLQSIVNAVSFSDLIIDGKKIQSDLENQLYLCYQTEHQSLEQAKKDLKNKNLISLNSVNLTKILEKALNNLLLNRINNFIKTVNEQADNILRHKDFNKFINLNKILIDKKTIEKFERNGFKLLKQSAIIDSMKCNGCCNIVSGITNTDIPDYFHKNNCKKDLNKIEHDKISVAQRIRCMCLNQKMPNDVDAAFPYILASITNLSLDACRIIEQYKQIKIEAFLNFYEILGKLNTYKQIEQCIDDWNIPEYNMYISFPVS